MLLVNHIRSLISGTNAGALPLPGFSNWDCSQRNCPMGTTNNKRYGYASVKEVQRVVCDKNIFENHSDYFVLQFMGSNTARIYPRYTAHQIRQAIEFSPLIGNVSIEFPHYKTDNISTACHTQFNATAGGFTVRFETELGDLPLMRTPTPVNVTITEVVKGKGTNEECGGSSMGFCDRGSG